MTRQIKLALYLHEHGLAAPHEPHPIGEGYDTTELVATAQLAEDAKFDTLFLADSPAFNKQLAKGRAAYGFRGDALITLAAVAAATSRIGLAATASSTFNHPYNLARQFLTLDQLSRGRVGWNLVTSSGGERQFGLAELPPQSERYRRAAEFLDVVNQLWDSWGPDAVSRDEEGHPVVDPDRIREIDVDGDFFRVEGALGLPRSVQGRPVLFQAGASDTGKPFGARYAEAIYSASPSFEHARALYSEFRQLAREFGRPEELPLILPGFNVALGATHEEAVESYRSRFTDDVLNAARPRLASQFGGIDLDGLELDEPIPTDRLPDIASLDRRRQSRPALYRGLAEQGLTLRRILELHNSGNGHYAYVGSYDEAADELEHWFADGAADGFVLGFLSGRDDLLAFIEHVIPRLQRRGLFRIEYEADTLRGNLGLPEPAVQYEAVPA